MRIETYQKSDHRDVLEMMGENFQQEKMRKATHFGAEYWRWQYANNPFGQAITLLAKENGALAGQYANIPVDLKLDGKVVKAATVIDLMVRPEFRRQGIFKKMGEEANRILSRENFALSLAFPSRKDSYAGFVQRLGWQVVGELAVMIGMIVPRSRTPGHQDTRTPVVKIKTADSFPAEVNGLWEEMKSQIKIGIARNQKYLNWRYGQNPATKYEIFLGFQNNDLAGYLVLKTERIMGIKLGIIVDMLCRSDAEVIRGLMHKGMKRLQAKGAQACVALKNSLYACALKTLGFWELPSWLNPKRYTLIIRANVADADLSLVSNLSNWFLTFGDWDLV